MSLLFLLIPKSLVGIFKTFQWNSLTLLVIHVDCYLSALGFTVSLSVVRNKIDHAVQADG